MYFDRTSQPSVSARQVSRTKIFPAPKKGWIRNESLAQPGGLGAEVMDNWFPTPEGCRMRKGSILRATCTADAAITHLATYETGLLSKIFATDATSIYDVTSPASASTALTPLVTSLSGGAWSSVQFAAGGGIYLVMANGTDAVRIYNGTLFGALDDGVTYKLSYDGQTGNFTVGDTLTGGTSGATGTIAFDNDGGTTGALYLTGVSGTFADNETITDATTGSATANGAAASVYPAISGVTTSDLSFVWAWKNRLMFIEGGTLNAWCLDTLSIGGTAHKIDLGGVFKYGGTLLFGGTWSVDSGSGLDDNCIFVTDNGEIAVYQGTDPTDLTAWSLVGVYRIGKPLGKNAFFKAGGDTGIATDDGIVSISQAVQKDRAALQGAAITFPIEEAWRSIITERAFSGFDFQTVLWQKLGMLVVTVPAFSGLSQYCLVVNSKTGAWARYTGWDARCAAILGDKFYFGTSTGTVVEGETGGADQDAAYAAVVIPRFDTFGGAEEKFALHQRIVARTDFTFSPLLFASADYVYDIPAPLPSDPDETGDTWGSGIWGEAVWGGQSDTKNAVSDWQAVAATGHALAPGVIAASGRATPPDLELIALHLQYQVGSVMV